MSDYFYSLYFLLGMVEGFYEDEFEWLTEKLANENNQ